MIDPKTYQNCLDYISERDGIEFSELSPVMLSSLMSLEEAIEIEFPSEYEEFVFEVGVGEEFGGLSEWFDLDLSMSTNIVNKNKELGAPKGFFAVYDQFDGTYIGFRDIVSGKKEYGSGVYEWDSQTGEISRVADNLYDFLEENLDCTIREYEEYEDSRRFSTAEESAAGLADIEEEFDSGDVTSFFD